MENDLISKQEVLEDLSEPFAMSQCMTVEECEAMNRARKLCLARVENIEPAQQWVPVTERLPELDGWYWVYAPEYKGGSSSGLKFIDGMMLSKFKSGRWSIEHGYYKRPGCVTHWMPLPEPPKEEP